MSGPWSARRYYKGGHDGARFPHVEVQEPSHLDDCNAGYLLTRCLACDWFRWDAR